MAARDIIQAAAGAAGATEANYIEDVFSTYLYTGTGAAQTINNGIDLATKGGLVWLKSRYAADSHYLIDTVRGNQSTISSNGTGAASTSFAGVSSFGTTGFTASAYYGNDSGYTYASWTFRKQPKFFDVVTYTGTGSARTIAHSLGVTPGMIIVKRLNSTGGWITYHKSLGATHWIALNSTGSSNASIGYWNNTSPTSSQFTLGNDLEVNGSGSTYVAYLFADSNSGGFGPAGTDSVVACGSFTGNTTVNLGWEPQLLIVKRTDTTGNWQIIDNMRGMPVIADFLGSQQVLFANTSGSEGTSGIAIPNSTGFNLVSSLGTYIYLAIRRGPMKTPTDATKVFAAASGVATAPSMVSGFPVDMSLGWDRDTPIASNGLVYTRLTGNTASLRTNTSGAEQTETARSQFEYMNGVNTGQDTSDKIGWLFRRAPGFFDVVCYTGTGAQQVVNHNLGVAPELIILKARSSDAYSQWNVWLPNVIGTSTAGALYTTGTWSANGNLTAVSSTSYTTGNNTGGANTSGGTHVAYLFATCPGISKVGSYTGSGTTKQIDCGFAAGARFVIIKRTDSTGNWYVWDTARGIVSGNDPYLLLNSTAAEVTNTDYIDPYSAGFEISSTAPAEINANGGSFVFLAIA